MLADLTLHEINSLLTLSVIVVLLQTFLENAMKTVGNLASVDVRHSNAGYEANESNQQQRKVLQHRQYTQHMKQMQHTISAFV